MVVIILHCEQLFFVTSLLTRASSRSERCSRKKFTREDASCFISKRLNMFQSHHLTSEGNSESSDEDVLFCQSVLNINKSIYLTENVPLLSFAPLRITFLLANSVIIDDFSSASNRVSRACFPRDISRQNCFGAHNPYP